MIYQKKKFRIKELILTHINVNLKEYILAFIILILGIIIGMFLLQNLSYDQKELLSQYINDIVSSLKEDTEIDIISLLKSSIINNIFFCMIMWFIGSTIIGLPIVYGMVGVKGFFLGYTISAVIAILGIGSGMIFVITSMLLQSMIIIPSTLALAVSATRFCKSIIKDRKKENIKYGIIKHTLFSCIICLLLIISSIIEVYVSTSLFVWSLKIF